MPKRKKPPELTFQQHVADFLVREHSYGVLEQSDITAEFVDDVAGEQRPLSRREQLVSADELRDNATAFDVSDQHNRNVRRFRKAHIGNVAVAQIYLSWAPCPLDEDEVGTLGESGE